MARDKNYFTSPRGQAVYPHLTIGDPDTKFDSDGVYKTLLRVPGPQAQEFMDEIDRLAMAWADHLDENEESFDASSDEVRVPYEEEDDGSVLFKFKMNAKGKTREGKTFTREPSLFDSMGEPCPNVEIGGGSEIRVAGEMSTYYQNGPVGAGITLYLNAVQVIKLEEYEPDAETFGFTAEGGGFSADRVDSNDASSDADEQADPDAEDFDF